MVSNRKIYLKCADDLKYIETFSNILEKEKGFIESYKPEKKDFHDFAVCKMCLEKLTEGLPSLTKDYEFLQKYIRDEGLLNGDDAENDILQEYGGLFERFCDLSNCTSDMSKSIEKLRKKGNK